MKKYLIVSKKHNGEVLTTSPTLIADHKVAQTSLKKSVARQLNELNDIRIPLVEYDSLWSEFYPLKIDDNTYNIMNRDILAFDKVFITVKIMTIKI